MTTTEEGTDMTRGPRPGDLPAGATWDDGRCDERRPGSPVTALDLDVIEANAWKYGARPPAHTVVALVSEVRRLRLSEQSSADAAHANYVAAEAAEGERDALRAKVAAVEARVGEWEALRERLRRDHPLSTLGRVGALARREANSLDVVAGQVRAALATTGEAQ